MRLRTIIYGALGTVLLGMQVTACCHASELRRIYSPSAARQTSRSLAAVGASTRPWEAPRQYPHAFPYGDYFGPQFYGWGRYHYGYRPYWSRSAWPYGNRYVPHWYPSLAEYGFPGGLRPYAVVPWSGPPYTGYPAGSAGWSPWWGAQGGYVDYMGSYYALSYPSRPPFPRLIHPYEMPVPAGPVLGPPADYYGYRPYQYDCASCCSDESSTTEPAPAEEPLAAPQLPPLPDSGPLLK